MRAVGLISGTSADGVTAALVDVGAGAVKVRRFLTVPYSRELRKRVLAGPRLAAPELSRLNFELGFVFAKAALKIGGSPEVIGSHGQTVWHGPDERPANTLQLAEASVIAERTGTPVVCDFRPRDMAAGGQGAPLVPAFDEFLFGGGKRRAVQNIGGIGNVSVVGKKGLELAFDTGPGNSLMDCAVRLAGKGEMDRGGRLAAKGWADARLVEKLLAHPYFSRRPPKSLDRTAFDERFVKRHFARRKLPDTLATLALFTARTIEHGLERFCPPVTELIVSGGGALNPTLMRAIRLRLRIPVKTTDDYGLPVMAKEAACFAWLAARAIKGKMNSCHLATGAKGRRVLGKIVPA